MIKETVYKKKMYGSTKIPHFRPSLRLTFIL